MSHKVLHTILKVYASIMLLLFSIDAKAQSDSTFKFQVQYNNENKEQQFNLGRQKLIEYFPSKDSATSYFGRLSRLAAAEGYLSFSIDEIQYDDHVANVRLFVGTPIKVVRLNVSTLKRFPFFKPNTGKDSLLMSYSSWIEMQQLLLDVCENNGYPFASAGLKITDIDGQYLNATLVLNENVFYRIDSISVKGDARIKNRLLQKQLFITNGMPYAADKLKQVDSRISTLGYVTAIQPSDVTMLGSGAVLNVYLKPKKTSQFNFLLGLQPESGGGKIRLTGDLNADLKNLFGSGEQIIFKWQQLQPLSPRLNIGYAQPYVFNSGLGIDTRFSLFKKDSSFLQLQANLGASFVVDAHHQGAANISWQSNRLLSGAVDTLKIISSGRLPQDIDMRLTAIGFQYQWNRTDYFFNPMKGNAAECKLQAGMKNISLNSDILNIKNPGFNVAQLYDSLSLRDYQIRLQCAAAHFFQIGKFSTIKAAMQGGAIFSRSLFRNEAFQLGGVSMLRGFDAESIFAKNYIIATAEYRFLFAKDAYFSLFSDWSRAQALYGRTMKQTDFISAGSGLQYQMKSGLLNLSIAMGKRLDLEFDIRSATKIHFGFLNYF